MIGFGTDIQHLILLKMYTFIFQCCNSDKYDTVTSAVMKNIYEAIKNIQSQPVVRYRPPSDDEEFDDYCDDDYSEDEGTSAPLKTLSPQTLAYECFSNAQTEEDPHSKLLRGYTEGNLEIKVIKCRRTPSLLLLLFNYLGSDPCYRPPLVLIFHIFYAHLIPLNYIQQFFFFGIPLHQYRQQICDTEN